MSFVIRFRFPFIACEVFTCEIDVILKTLVEEEEVNVFLLQFVLEVDVQLVWQLISFITFAIAANEFPFLLLGTKLSS